MTCEVDTSIKEDSWGELTSEAIQAACVGFSVD